MKLVIDHLNRVVNLDGIRSLSVEQIMEEAQEAYAPQIPLGSPAYGLWANYDNSNEDVELIWVGTEVDCRGRLAYIARKNAALDLKVMP